MWPRVADAILVGLLIGVLVKTGRIRSMPEPASIMIGSVTPSGDWTVIYMVGV